MNEAIGSAQTELEEFIQTRVVRRRLFPRAVLVGVASGAVATAFRFSVAGVELLRGHFVERFSTNPVVLAAIVGLIAAIGCAIALLIGTADKDAGGSGIPHMKSVLEGHSSMNWPRLLVVKFFAGIAALGSGLALGREGPTVQMGGATGIAIADLTGASGREKRALAAAGAGSGLAAAFNAPLAGVTFVLEELQRDFQPVVFGAALMSATIATVLSRFASGQLPAFEVPPISAPALAYLPAFILIGIVCGVFGILFNRGLLDSSERIGKVRSRYVWLVPIGIGVASALTFLVSPELLGGGHNLTELAVHGQILLWPALVYLVTRLVFIHLSYSTGVAGGIFAPLLSLGALLGLCVHHGLISSGVAGISVAACVVCGMCGLFSSVVRAPLTGIILIAEMTGSYDMLLPLLASAFTAYAVADGLGDIPIYEALLQRDAERKGWTLGNSDLITGEFEVKPGSAYEGKRVNELGLPPGVLIVLCRAEGKEMIPKAKTMLKAHMRIVIATSSANEMKVVEDGTRGT